MNRILVVSFATLWCCEHMVEAADEVPTETTTAKAGRQRDPATRRTQPGSYLETGGERKLNVLYKQVSGKDLHLDLYYPTANRAEQSPVIIFTHGGGWAAGNRYKAATGPSCSGDGRQSPVPDGPRLTF